MTLLAARVQALEARFRTIAATRMAGVALCHPRLQVVAVGFEPLPGSGGAAGVLVTPWFMNLVFLPLHEGAGADTAAPGVARARVLGPERFDFIGAHEDGLGPFEACSLFSPMDEFADQAAALATATAVLALLRPPPQPQQPAPARRRFLLGAARTAP